LRAEAKRVASFALPVGVLKYPIGRQSKIYWWEGADSLWRERTLATTRIVSWDTRVKGIDDAVVRNLPITSISVQQWLDRLSHRFRQIAMARLSEITALPLRAKNRSGSQGRRRC